MVGARLTFVRTVWLASRTGQAECGRSATIATLGTGMTVFSPVRLHDGSFVVGGLFPEARLAFLDSMGEVKRYAGAFPATELTVPPSVLQHAYQATVVVRPDETRIAVLSRHSSLLELFDIRGTLIRREDGPLPVKPVFTVRKAAEGAMFASGDSLRFGYVAAAADQDHVYALFSGRARFEAPGRANLGDRIHMFDWEGRFVAEYRLNGEALNLAIDPSRRIIYVAHLEPTPSITAYTLPGQ